MAARRLLPALTFLVLLIALTGGAADARSGARSAPAARAVGVTLSSGPGGAAQAYRLAVAAGANAIEAPQPWSTLEPAPGRFRLADIGAIVRGVRSAPATQVMVIPAAIETTRRSVPADLARAPWDGHRMIDRYRGLLRHLAPRLSRQVRYVSIANEADVYFATHRRELPAFLRFAGAEIAELHRLAPWANVGVTVTYGGLTGADAAVARRLAKLGDATILTYYPLAGGFQMGSPRSPLRDLPRMVRLAAGEPLVVQEAGYSSSPRIGGSPAAQARFVRDVFRAWNRQPRAIPFLSFYTLFDPPASQCRSPSDEVTFFCSLGLHYGTGRAKPAWAAFREGAGTIRTRAEISP